MIRAWTEALDDCCRAFGDAREQELRERAFVEGRAARAASKPIDDNPHLRAGADRTCTTDILSAAFELGWRTEDRRAVAVEIGA